MKRKSNLPSYLNVGLTVVSISFLSALKVQAAMTRTSFECQVDGDATEISQNSVIKYHGLGISFLKDSSDRTERMNIELRGTRTTKTFVPVGYKPGNPDDGMSLMISEKDFRMDSPKQDDDKEAKNKTAPKNFWGINSTDEANTKRPFDDGSKNPSSLSGVNPSSSTMLGGSSKKIFLDGSTTVAPIQPPEEKYDVVTTTSESVQTLVYDYAMEVLEQEYQKAEIIAENIEREAINESRRLDYQEILLQYKEDLRDAHLQSLASGNPLRYVAKPREPFLEPMLSLPNNPLNISYIYKRYAAERHQPKSTFNITLNSSSIAEMECIQTNNLVDNKSSIEADVKGKYNEKAASKAAAADPRAKGFGGGFALPTINRMEREMWCKKTTLVGSINLVQFGKGKFKVKCEYKGSQPSDN